MGLFGTAPGHSGYVIAEHYSTSELQSREARKIVALSISFPRFIFHLKDQNGSIYTTLTNNSTE